MNGSPTVVFGRQLTLMIFTCRHYNERLFLIPETQVTDIQAVNTCVGKALIRQ